MDGHRIGRIMPALLVLVPAVTACAVSASQTTPTPTPTSAEKSGNPLLPRHFRITSEGSTQDCLIEGDRVRCSLLLDPLPDNYDAWTGEVTGTLSGLTLTGTSTTTENFHQRDDPNCRTEQHRSGPVTYDFDRDGTVVMGEGLMRYETWSSGSCPGTSAEQQWGGQGTGVWSPAT